MDRFFNLTVLLLILLLLYIGAKAEYSADVLTESKSLVHIGAVFDPETVDGVIAEISINLAISDFYAIHPNYQTRLYVHFATAKDLVGTAAAGLSIKYEFVHFEDKNGEMAGTYDDLLNGINRKELNAVVGDITILANRIDFVDFTLPYTESGLTMLVPAKHDNLKNMWIFLKPWTWDLWLTAFSACIVIAVVTRIMEHRTGNSDYRGSPRRQLGLILMFPFCAMVIPQIKQLEPTYDDLEKLRREDHFVGFQNGSYIEIFLVQQLNFSRDRIRPFTNYREYNEALFNGSKRGGASAIFEEIPYIRVFLKKYGSVYTTAGPIYRTDGFGFKPVALARLYLSSRHPAPNETESTAPQQPATEPSVVEHSLQAAQADDLRSSSQNNEITSTEDIVEQRMP
ncbi:Glutamate receptor [Melia azedarach]|uniref:Glutamate receptor n=1 Tax=Melia azedarach TaxID=155640 RepID=A0ACC1XDC5_MELAZ|nr:Glutamate receptor [Melia azedarach]